MSFLREGNENLRIRDPGLHSHTQRVGSGRRGGKTSVAGPSLSLSLAGRDLGPGISPLPFLPSSLEKSSPRALEIFSTLARLTCFYSCSFPPSSSFSFPKDINDEAERSRGRKCGGSLARSHPDQARLTDGQAEATGRAPRAHTKSRRSPSLLGRVPHPRKGGGERWTAWTRGEP